MWEKKGEITHTKKGGKKKKLGRRRIVFIKRKNLSWCAGFENFVKPCKLTITREIAMASATETYQNASSSASASMRRKDKRKVTKKEKRKQKRKEVAEMERQEEEAQLNDTEEQRRIQLEMEMEKERSEKERREFEERERIFLEELARKKAEEEEERRRALEEEKELKENQAGLYVESNESDEWEYVDDGPPEIIWQGNEIIVKKNRVKVKKSAHQEITAENPSRPTSNPLPPQSEAYIDYKNASVLTAQQLLENVAQQTPNFGTEQDKAHCPFHLKTGACRFGSRCSRVHFYPDKSCTLLMKNMYNGPGLAWEQDEGLEYTDEEVERSYEEFYEDVHTEFLKFGEIINFKVCRNGSYHLRGNVYVHYKSVDSAMLAYQIINGRYFSGKQVSCEFVSVTRWRVAICGDYMKSRLKTCSRGTACNFIHSFRNPCGDYEWADWDKPPPRFWVEKMVALFGYSDDYIYDTRSEDDTVGTHQNSSKRLEGDRERHHRKRSRSKESDDSKRRSREHYEEDNSPRIKYHQNEDKRRTCDLVHELDEVKYRFGHHENSKKRDYHHDEYDLSQRQNDDDEFSEKASSGKRSVSIDSDRYRWRRSNGSDSKTYLSDGITTKTNHSETSSSHRKKKVHGTKTTSEVEFPEEHLKSSYKKYNERSRSYDSSDFSCDSSSALEFETNLEETEMSDRWVPDNNMDTRKHDKEDVRSDGSYKKRKNKDRGSNKSSSDACIKDSSGRARG